MNARRERLIYQLLPHVEYHQHRYARALDAHVPREARWLDLGAGTRLHHGWVGANEEVLAERATLIVGCDFVVKHLRENTRLDAALAADGAALPFRPESFDIVTANMVLEHLDRPARVFAEVARVLAPGGRFIFVTPNATHPAVVTASLIPRRIRSWVAGIMEGREAEHIFPTHYRANTVARVRALAEDAGLEPVVVERFSSWPMTVREALPLFLLESALVSLSRGPLDRLASNLIGVLRRPNPGATAATAR